MLFIDTETTGLNARTDRVTLFQFKRPNEPTQLWQDPDLKAVHQLLDSADIIIGHNLPFDFRFLNYIPKSIDHFDDTFYLSKLVDFREDRHSLDKVAFRNLGYDAYKDFDKKRLQKSDWAQATLTDEQIAYASTDVEVLPPIYELYKHAIKNGVYRFDKRSILAGLHVQQHGLPVLHDEVKQELTSQQVILANLLEELPCNPNSPKQVCALLRLDSSSDRVMAELIAVDPSSARGETAGKIRAARKAAKYINFLSKLNADERYYGSLAPAARSGRFTSSQNNIQNLPRDTKKFIGASVIISADFAQLELRTIAAIAQDKTMLDLFKSGEDLHNYAATQMYGKGFTKLQRQIAKVFNFSLLYGAGAATVRTILIQQTGIILAEAEVAQLKRKWLLAFTGIALWQRQGSERHNQGKPHQTPHGRPYISNRFTDHLSIENQGAGAEVARIALHRMQDTLPATVKLFNFIHDSYQVEAPDDPAVYKEVTKLMHDAMKFAWQRAPFKKHGLEMPVEVGVAYNLKNADSLEDCIYIYKGEVA